MSGEGPGQTTSLGCRISGAVADFAAHPFVQIGFILICVGWFALGLRVDVLTAALSIIAITLTQMVLNRQQEREVDAHRRDVALHAKLDELLHASRRARDELAGIETLEEKEIEALRNRGLKEESREAGDALRPADASGGGQSR